jgi:chorismate mutase
MTLNDAQRALDDLRAQIDVVDLKILELFNERARVVEAIGEIKRVSALPIYEPKREELVFENVLSHNAGPLASDAVHRMFERIMDEMRTLQRERMRRVREAQQEPPDSAPR